MKLDDIDKNVLRSQPTLASGMQFDRSASTVNTPDKKQLPVNTTGKWILEQLTGRASVSDIVNDALKAFPDVSDEVIKRDIIDFIYNLYQWGFIENINLPPSSSYYAPRLNVIDFQIQADTRSGCGMCKETYV